MSGGPGPVSGSYADFITRACGPLLAAAESPDAVTPAEAERWWPILLAHNCRLLRLTRPIAIRRHGHPEREGIEWGLERLNDLPLTYRRPPPIPAKTTGDSGRLRDVAVNVAHAGDLIQTAKDTGRPMPPHERVGLCRQAIGVLDATAQVVARTTVFDPTRANTTDAALRTAAITAAMVSGPQVLLSRLDSMTSHARRASGGLGDDWPTAVEHWRSTATRTLREGASSRMIQIVATTQNDLLDLAHELSQRTRDPEPVAGLIDNARISWDIDWRGTGLAGGEPTELGAAHEAVNRAMAAVTPPRMRALEASIACEQILDLNCQVADATYGTLMYGIGTGKLFGRCDLIDPRAVAYGADPGQWIPIPADHRVARQRQTQTWQCLHAAEEAADTFLPAPPSPDLSAAGQVAAVLQALDAARPGGPTPGGRIRVAEPTPAVRR